MAVRVFKAFVRILLIANISLNETLLTFFLYVRQTWITQLIQAISLRGFIFLYLAFLTQKSFSTNMHFVAFFCEIRTSFCTGLIARKLLRFLLMFSTGFTSLNVLLLFPLLPTFFLFMHSF